MNDYIGIIALILIFFGGLIYSFIKTFKKAMKDFDDFFKWRF